MRNKLSDANVAVIDTGRMFYPERPPFHPPEAYPEYPFNNTEIDCENYVYDATLNKAETVARRGRRTTDYLRDSRVTWKKAARFFAY